VAAEWNLVTLHGESPCDGIGGTVKQLVACASLQATERSHILTQDKEWAKNITGITFFYITQKGIKTHVLRQDSGYNMLNLSLVHAATTSVCPSTVVSLIYFLSSDKDDTGTKVSVTGLTCVAVQTSQSCPTTYDATVNNDGHIACNTANNECDIFLKFMFRNGQDILIFS
jgi:hypothetical protein